MRLLAPALVLAVCLTVAVSGCSSVRGLAHDALADRGAGGAPCPSSADPEPADAPTPSSSASLDPTVAGELRDGMAAIRALPGVASATQATTNTPSRDVDPTCPTRITTTNHFATVVTVVTSADATAAQAAAVPTTLAEHLAWTGVDLTETVPAGPGHVATAVHYDGTFDQRIPIATSTAVAEGLATLAATPHVAGLDATIPMTMRVDYGSLTIGVDSTDQGVLDGVRAVIDTTAFRSTTLHGSFGNGAKP